MTSLNVIALLFISVAINHMGLIEAVEEKMGCRLWVVDCTKCLTFWSALAYLLVTRHPLILSLAMAFALSYAALWLELLWGLADRVYLKCYEKIVSNAASGSPAADAAESHTEDSVPHLRKGDRKRK